MGEGPVETGTQPRYCMNSPPKLDDRFPDTAASEYRAALIAITALFFLWALPNNLNNILIRQFD
jgi:hypothetical protein